MAKKKKNNKPIAENTEAIKPTATETEASEKNEHHKMQATIEALEDNLMLFIGDALDEEAEDLHEDTESEKEVTLKLPQFTSVFVGVVVLAFAIIGAITSIRFAFNLIEAEANNKGLIADLSQLILPISAFDAPPFESLSSLSEDVIITAACWDVILSPDEAYTISGGNYTISYLDIDARVNKIFGEGVYYNHRTVGDEELLFEYNEETKMYTIPTNPRHMSYFPTVEEITKTENGYSLLVSYRLPVSKWMSGDSIEKYMNFTVVKSNGEYKIISSELGEVVSGEEL